MIPRREDIFCPDPSLQPLLHPHSPLGITSHSCPVSTSHSNLFPQPQASRVRPASQVLAREEGSQAETLSGASAGKGLGHPALLAPLCDAVAGDHEAAPEAANHSLGKTSWGSRPLGSACRAQSSPGRMSPHPGPHKNQASITALSWIKGDLPTSQESRSEGQVAFPGQEVTGPSYFPGEKHRLMPPPLIHLF